MGDAAAMQGLAAKSPSYFDHEMAELMAMMKYMPSTNLLTAKRPPYTFKSGAVYDGEWKGCMRHGYGVQQWPDGTTYAGEWEESRAEGRGRFVHCDGEMYIGEWRANTAHGKGVYYQKDLSTYTGEWSNDL